VRLRWFPGVRSQQVDLPQGQTSLQISHTYPDDNDRFEQSKQVAISVLDRVSPPGTNPNDNTGGGLGNAFKNLPLQVVNVAPSFVDRGITVTKKSNTQVVVEGDVVDPGSADQIQVTATWGDPIAPGATACSIGRDGRHFVCEHTYRANVQAKTYPIHLTVKDDDGGIDQYQTTVRLP
jgi:hypothetical protein